MICPCLQPFTLFYVLSERSLFLIAWVLCVCLSFVPCNRVICMSLVCMKCVNCFFFISDTIYIKLLYVYVVTVVCSIIGRGVWGLF